MKLQVGQQVPEIHLPDQDGAMHKLSDYKGQWVLVYFYPEDDTPGCTTEACSLRDNLPSFKDVGAVVLGISVDSVSSHKKFADKYGLPFTLLADEQKKAVADYGVWQEKNIFPPSLKLRRTGGHKHMGTLRTSFLIDPQGTIAKIYEKVKPEIHAGQVLADLSALR
jgi:peroxiredoxin Q/BCP